MQRFKRIILNMQGKNKSELHWLYNTKSLLAPPLIFDYSDLKFSFSGTNYRTSEKLLMYVDIPGTLLGDDDVQNSLPHETYLLHTISPILSELSKSYQTSIKMYAKKHSLKLSQQVDI